MEENQVQDYNYKDDILELQKTIEVNTNSINNIKDIIEKELQKKEQEKKELEKIEKQQEEENQIKIEEEKQELQDFYTNIETIAKNTNSEMSVQLLNDVSTLMQTNIMCFGLLIGFLAVSLLAKFFRK